MVANPNQGYRVTSWISSPCGGATGQLEGRRTRCAASRCRGTPQKSCPGNKRPTAAAAAEVELDLHQHFFRNVDLLLFAKLDIVAEARNGVGAMVDAGGGEVRGRR